jgi:hypothetical protein
MRWQDHFQVDGGERVGIGMTVVVILLVLMTTTASYFHRDRAGAQAVLHQAREQIAAMTTE